MFKGEAYIIQAFKQAVKVAFQAVRKPVEGRLAEPLRLDRLEHLLIAGDEQNIAISFLGRVGVDRARQRWQTTLMAAILAAETAGRTHAAVDR